MTIDYYRKCSVCRQVREKVVVLPGFYKICPSCTNTIQVKMEAPTPSREEVLLGLINRIVKTS